MPIGNWLRTVSPVIAVIFAVLVSGGCAGRASRVSFSDDAGFDRMMKDIGNRRIIFVGEFHDRREHHDLQLKIIKALHRSGRSFAIGLEMFDMESQPTLDSWVSGKMDLKEFVAYYRQQWTILWSHYGEIFLYARNNRIPLVGLDAPADLVRKTAQIGFRALPVRDLARLPDGVKPSMGKPYREFVRDAFSGHPLGEGSFANFCDAHGVRNSTMARLIEGRLRAEPRASLVVLTGVGHAMRGAVMQQLDKEYQLQAAILLPEMEELTGLIDEGDADYFVHR